MTVILDPQASRNPPLTKRLVDIAAQTPASYFGMVLGLCGLSNAWRAGEQTWHLPGWISEAILAVATVIWVLLVILLFVKAVAARARLLEEIAHPVQCCFFGLAGVSTMLIAGGALPYSHVLSWALFIVGAVFTLAFGIWRTGGLWHGERDHATTTAVLYLPTVAGSFVTATVIAALGHPDWGQLAFGAGLFSWLAMESVLLHRLLIGPQMPAALRPSIGVQLAPAPVGAVAYLSVAGGEPDVFVHALVGYGVLQLLILARLSPWLREAGPVMGFWAFSFGATSIATASVRLVGRGDAGAIAGIAPILFFVANVFLSGLAIMTVRLLASGRLYPAVPKPK